MYDREVALKTSFNRSVTSLLGIEEKDYYSKLTTTQILSLKSVLSDINNLLTLRLTFSLAEWICDRFNISGDARRTILDTIRASKPNTNGYDIELSFPAIVAEVKCNIPINAGTEYGSAQRNGLRKDIEGLVNGKSKSSKVTSECFKLLGLCDTAEVRAATDHFVKNLPADLNRKLVIEPNGEDAIDDQHVYIVFVK
ncbi:MAG: hypothetical protein M0P16_10845 [Syntrophales bacterium]|jgi:hypothetical protein|nr:hypothetical protein [Syntrophales bacterium]